MPPIILFNYADQCTTPVGNEFHSYCPIYFLSKDARLRPPDLPGDELISDEITDGSHSLLIEEITSPLNRHDLEL